MRKGMSQMITKLEHVGILVTDMERSIDFYQKAFGLTLRHREWITEKVELSFLYHPNQENIEIELIGGKTAETTEGIVNHLAFSVDHIEEEITRLKQLGVNFDNETPRVVLGGVKIAFFTGPDGEVLELVQR